MSLTAVVSLLQLVLALLTAVHGNPFLPQSVRDGAYALAQQAVAVANESLLTATAPQTQTSGGGGGGGGSHYAPAGGGGTVTNNATNATPPETTTEPSLVELLHPSDSETVTAGGQYTIQWDASSDLVASNPRVDIILAGMQDDLCDPFGCGMSAPKLLAKLSGTSVAHAATQLVIASNVALDDGRYTWNVPANISSQVPAFNHTYKIYFNKTGTQTPVLPFTDTQFIIN